MQMDRRRMRCVRTEKDDSTFPSQTEKEQGAEERLRAIEAIVRFGSV